MRHEIDRKNTVLGKLAAVGMTTFRLMLCPGDDVLVVTSAFAVGINNDHSEHQAALPARGPRFIEGEMEDSEGGRPIKALFPNPLY